MSIEIPTESILLVPMINKEGRESPWHTIYRTDKEGKFIDDTRARFSRRFRIGSVEMPKTLVGMPLDPNELNIKFDNTIRREDRVLLRSQIGTAIIEKLCEEPSLHTPLDIEPDPNILQI